MVSTSVYLGNLCCGHCSALTRDPTWDGAILLSAPENLATGSSQLVPLLRLSSGEESLLMHVMPPPRDSPSPKSGPGRGRPTPPLASTRDNSDGHPSKRGPCLYYKWTAIHLFHLFLHPSLPVGVPQKAAHKPPASQSPSLLSLLLWQLKMWCC